MLVRLITLGLALLVAVGVQARELRVALGAQDAIQLHSSVGMARPQPGGLSGFNEALAREICRRVAARCVIS